MPSRRPDAPSRRPLPPPGPNHADKRGRILAAARRLFASRSYQAITMERVAKAAGVAKGTLYLYFSSKEALYLGILSDGLENVLRRCQAGVDPSAGVTERLRRAIDVSVEFYDGERDLLRLLACEEPRIAAARNRLFQSWRERGFGFFTALIEEGIRAGLFAPIDSRLATLAILGGIRSVLLYYGARRAPAQLGHELGELILHGLGEHGLGERAAAPVQAAEQR